MTDVHGKEARSRNMRAIRHKNTKPEVWLRSQLHRRGFRFRIHVKELPGTPDIVLPKYKAVILFNGCFWHKHDCHLFKMPATRTEFWSDKIGKNAERDRRNIAALKEAGWRVLTVWECALKGLGRVAETDLLANAERWITSGEATEAVIDSKGLSEPEMA